MSFRDLACEHLSRYKVDVLGIVEEGIFNYRGKLLPKAHILPLKHREKNILEQYRNHFFSSEYAKIDFHRYFHHLNSSQALCINLFYPLIVENSLSLFMKFVELPAQNDLNSLFEKDSDIEVAQRKTSFDYFVQNGDAGKVFVEVKYTEGGFGKAKNDEEHRTKFIKTYLPLVTQKKSFLQEGCDDVGLFLKHYQILRNLVHVSSTDHVVLLFPSENTSVAKDAVWAIENLLNDAGRSRLKIVFLDEFVRFLEGQCDGTILEGYYQDFRTKYLPAC